MLSLFLVGCAGPRPLGSPSAPQVIVPQNHATITLPLPTAPHDQPPPTPLPTRVVAQETTEKTGVAAEVGDTSAAPVDSAQTNSGQVAAQSNRIDLTHLPIGDGKISGGPQVGYIWACRTDPNAEWSARFGCGYRQIGPQ